MSTLPPARSRTPLERFRTGAVDAAGYLELKIREATAHLHFLPASQLESIQSALRDRLQTDPDLLELVRIATSDPQ